MKTMKTIYVITEECKVIERDEDCLENFEMEPVVCVDVGAFEDQKKAQRKANHLNWKFQCERYGTKPLKVTLNVRHHT